MALREVSLYNGDVAAPRVSPTVNSTADFSPPHTWKEREQQAASLLKRDLKAVSEPRVNVVTMLKWQRGLVIIKKKKRLWAEVSELDESWKKNIEFLVL